MSAPPIGSSLEVAAGRLAHLLTAGGDELSDPTFSLLEFERDIELRPLTRGAAPADVWAVDGGQALVADARCLQVLVTRAARVRFVAGACVLEDEGELRAHLLGNRDDRAAALAGLELDLAPDTAVDINLLRDRWEWDAVARCVAEAQPGAFVLIDGDLQPDWRIPSAWLAQVVADASERGVVLAGVVKRSSLARGGAPLLGQLELEAEHDLGPRAMWWARVAHTRTDVYPGLQVLAARLDPDARFAFRVDLPADVDPEPALQSLAALADDAAFPGYPYPLTVADRLAACPGWVRQEARMQLDDLLDQAGVPLDVRERAFADRHDLMERVVTSDGVNSKGRLFGKNVLEGTFRAAPDEDLFLGELLVAVDEANGRRYVFRIVDVTYGTEHREPGWAERVAGTMLTDDARDDEGAHPLYEQGRRTYRVATCRCLGYLTPDGKQFRKPKSLPTQFSKVIAPEPSDFEFLRSRMGDLPVGELRSGETVVDFEVGIPGASLASHVGIFATTGMGKSNLMKVIAAGVMRLPGLYGLLVVDPHGEYRHELARHPWAGQRLRTYAARPLPNTSRLRISLAELMVDDLRTAYEWSRPQEEALFELERHYDGNGLSWLLEFSHLDDLAGFRDVELGGRIALNTLQVVHRRARRIIELDCIAPDPNVSVGGAVVNDLKQGKVVLVDASGLGSTEEVLIASFLTRRVLDEWSALYLHDPDAHRTLPVVTVVLEEAQRVLSANQDRESNVFPRVAREGRKFKVGLCAITQQPKLLDDELLSQFNTFFILGLADEKDRTILRGSSKQDISALGPEIQTLMPGECLIANLEAPFALPARVYLYDDVVRNTPEPPAPRAVAAPAVAALVD